MTPLEYGPVPQFQYPSGAKLSPWGMGVTLSVFSLILVAPWPFSSFLEGMNPLSSMARKGVQHRVAIMLDAGIPDAEGPGRGQAKAVTGLGRNQPMGGSYGTGTVGPDLLKLKLVPPTFTDPNGPLNSEAHDLGLRIVGDPMLPVATGGDGHPSGRGNGFGSGNGDGMGSAGGRGGGAKAKPIPTEWGVLRKVPAVYPYQARLHHIEGYVVVMVTVDALGRPTALRPLSGSDLLMPECLRVLKLWQFEPPGKYGIEAPATFPMTYLFRLDEPQTTQ